MKYFLIIICIIIVGLLVGIGWSLFGTSLPVSDTPNPNVTPEWADLYEVQNSADLAQLETQTREVFSNFISNNNGEYGWQAFSVANKQVPVAVGLPSLGVVVPSEIQQYLNTADWGVRSCESAPDKPKFILRFVFAQNADGTFVSYEQKQRLLQEWENNLLINVQSVIFPAPYYESSGLSISNGYRNNTTFDVTYIRQTDVMRGPEKVSEFGYMILSEEVLIGNDLNCMDEFAADLLGVVP